MSYNKEDPGTIQELFNAIAPSYDRTNAILSLGFHKRWNRQLVDSLSSSTPHPVLLDLCAGTGEIGFQFLQKNPSSTAILLDFSAEMLAIAEKKGSLFKNRVTVMVADAEKIPLDASSVDLVSIAYGIRNIRHMPACFNETFRVMKRGGQFCILELTRPSPFLLRFGHTAYLRFFLPLLGKWAAKNSAAYTYLSSSIQQFSTPLELKKSLETSGFSEIEIFPLMGGIATLLIAKKT